MTSDTDQYADESEDWAQYLTDELRRHFERTGRYLVEQQVLDIRYESPTKRKAAMVWLGEQRKKDGRAEKTKTCIALVVAVLAAFGGAMIGAWITNRGALELQEQQTVQERQALTEALLADITALRDEENRRRNYLEPLLKLLIEKDQTQEGGRPWLMAPLPMRFPVFEENAGRLGLMQSPAPEKVAAFYGMSYLLRSHINTVTSPAMLLASKRDKTFAVSEYVETLEEWNRQADHVLTVLNN